MLVDRGDRRAAEADTPLIFGTHRALAPNGRPMTARKPDPHRCRVPGWKRTGSGRIFGQLAIGCPEAHEGTMSKADDLRKEAKQAGKRGDKTKSLKEGAREHKREKALNDMADNEDWLDGKPKPKASK